MTIRELHDKAYRRRAGMIGMLHGCICAWPEIVESNETGHAESCPTHAQLQRGLTHRYEPGIGWVAIDGTVESSVNPHACCPRDRDGDGQCDIHSAPGVLRPLGKRMQ